MALPKGYKQEAKPVGRYTMNSVDDDPTKIRMVTDFITGLSVWGDDDEGNRKCTRVKNGERMPVAAIGINKFSGQPERVKDFIAAVCWNYRTEQFEIFETDKSSVIEQIIDAEMTEEYGDCKGYDMKIIRKGEGKDTRYTVTPLPPKKLDSDIADNFLKEKIDLKALYRGDDPFAYEKPAV